MKTKYKLTIPEPCTESWDKMTPNENGRFCLSCSKTVIDFTSMLSSEIEHFFIQNQNKNVCGRFKNSQLDTINIQIPSRILHNQTYYHKMFLLALFIAMGATLFSCQDKNEKKQKIDTVEINADTTKIESSIDKTLIRKNDSVQDVKAQPKVDHHQSVKPNNNFKSEKRDNNKNSLPKVAIRAASHGEVVSETNAEFPGGIEQFYNYFEKEFKNPENLNTKSLKINLSFAVEKNGSVSYLQSEPAIEQPLEKEIIRVLSLSPKWQPGESNGKKIKRQYSLPIVLE